LEEYIGVDGCRAGWFAVGLDPAGRWRFDVYPDFDALWAGCQEASLILVDIPIGLVDTGRGGRQCDAIARRLLSPNRASSVFTPPTRPALDATDYQAASAINRALTGKSITIQSWNIGPKIRQVDRFLRHNARARARVREAHPELLFWALNGRQAMTQRKKKLGGYDQRLAVLRRHFEPAEAITQAALARYRRAQVARDDILDALVAALTGYLSQGRLQAIPADRPRDAYGLAMEMVYYEPGR
jgi:predicted RNase H-like nuclease